MLMAGFMDVDSSDSVKNINSNIPVFRFKDPQPLWFASRYSPGLEPQWNIQSWDLAALRQGDHNEWPVEWHIFDAP